MNLAAINLLIFIIFDIISYTAFQIIGYAYFKSKTSLPKFILLGMFCVFSTTFVYVFFPNLNILYSVIIKMIIYLQYTHDKIRVFLFSIFLTVIHAFFEMLSCGFVAVMAHSSISEVLMDSTNFLQCEVISAFSFYLMALYIYKFFSQKEKAFPKPYSWAVVVLTSLLSLCMFWFLFMLCKNKPDFGYLVIIGIFLILTIFNSVVFYCLYKINDYYELKQSAQFMETYISSQKNMMENKQKNDETIRMMSHNLKHIVNDISILLEQHKYEDIKNILDNQKELLTHSDFYVNTPDMFMNALLNEKFSMAHNLGIAFDTDILLDSCIPIKPDELSFILGNLLDNAIEYLQSSSLSSPSFSFQMKFHAGVFALKIANPVEQDIPIRPDMTIQTTKEDRKLHGYGLKSIGRTVEHLDGVFQLSCENRIFCAKIFIQTED